MFKGKICFVGSYFLDKRVPLDKEVAQISLCLFDSKIPILKYQAFLNAQNFFFWFNFVFLCIKAFLNAQNLLFWFNFVFLCIKAFLNAQNLLFWFNFVFLCISGGLLDIMQMELVV